jgi:hypothetical protein
MDSVMIIPLRVAERTLFESEARSRASSLYDKGCEQKEASEVLLPI